MTAHYRHLIIDDRIGIQKLYEQGTSKTQIARRIGVQRATIGRELRRGAWQPEHDHANLRPYLRNRLDTRGPLERLDLGNPSRGLPRTMLPIGHSHMLHFELEFGDRIVAAD